MKPQIDPKVDCVFKAMLGSEEHKALLVHFLNAVLARDPGIRIRTVELLNPYNEREFESDKLSVVDVKARDKQGRVYQIEIQLATHPGLTSRMLYMWSALYHRQIEKGQAYVELKPAISIWLLNEPLFDIPEAWHVPFVPWNCEHELKLSDDFRIHLLQLPLWPRHEQAQEDLDRWMYLFTEGKEVDAASPPPILQTSEMKEAITVLKHFSENERQYWLYQQRIETEHMKATWEQAMFQAKRIEENTKRIEENIKRIEENTKRKEEEIKRIEENTKRKEEEIKRIEENTKRMEEETRRMEEEAKRIEEEAKRKEEEAKRKEKEARQQAKREQQEKERLLALLKQAGIDPNL